MIYQNVELHGAEEIYEAKGGIALRRVPVSLHNSISKNGVIAAHRTGGCEIRFVPDREVYITLSTLKEGDSAHLTVYHGCMQRGTLWAGSVIVGNEPKRFMFRKSPDFAFLCKTAEQYNQPFDPQVIRIVCDSVPIVIHSIEGSCRPPSKNEKPDKTMLFYGSSICHGAAAPTGDLNWPFLTAKKLGIDHINFGFPASGLYEPEIADYIAGRNDWDCLFLEIGINFYSDEISSIKKRVKYMLETVRKAHPEKYIFCTDIFYANTKEDISVVREAIKTSVLEVKDEKIIFIDALSLMGEANLLSEDHVHPSVEGHIKISDNLYNAIKKYF